LSLAESTTCIDKNRISLAEFTEAAEDALGTTVEFMAPGSFSPLTDYIRHPLYSSLLFLAWGIFFKIPSWSGALLALMATLFLFATARADEAECIRFFGPAYEKYMKKTKRFVPFLF